MPKVKGHTADIVVPSKNVIESDGGSDEGYEDENDDEIEEQHSREGILAAADDLSVLDFFAGCALIGLVTRGDGGPNGLGKNAYDIAKEMVEARAVAEDTEE